MIMIDNVSSLQVSRDYYNTREEWLEACGLPKIEYEGSKTFSKFFGVTYAKLADIRRVLLYHVNGHFAFIQHDRDILSVSEDGEMTYKVPHVHVYIYDGGRHTVSAVEKWFKGLVDEKGREVNTFFEPAVSERGCLRYLLHLDDQEKTAYDMKEVHISSYTMGNKLFDACSDSGNSTQRKISTLISFAKGEINYIEASKRCPELFLANAQNVRSLVKRYCFDLGIADRYVKDDLEMREEYYNGIAVNNQEQVQEQ